MAEGGGLLNRYTGQNLYRGFESLSLRHLYYQLLSIKPTPKSVLEIQDINRPLYGRVCEFALRFPVNSLADITQSRLRSVAFLWLPRS